MIKSLSESVLDGQQEVVEVRRGRPRKIAPNIDVEIAETCERMDLLRMYAPECVEKIERNTFVKDPRHPSYWRKKNPEFKEFFGDPLVPVDHYKRLGYEPVIADGKHINHKGDPLYKLPYEKWQANQDKTVGRGLRMFASARTGKGEEYGNGKLSELHKDGD